MTQDFENNIRDYNNEPSIKNIGDYYRTYYEWMVDYGRKYPTRFFDSYPFDWVSVMTPIELDAWKIIRSLGRIVLYPQFPILKYRADFANPTLKIILECDGKGYHNKERDIVRDTVLYKDGWKTFRVTGSELYKDLQLQWDEDKQRYTDQSLQDYYLRSAEGVIHALRDIYFLKSHEKRDVDDDNYDYLEKVHNLQIETLQKHSLIDFKL